MKIRPLRKSIILLAPPVEEDRTESGFFISAPTYQKPPEKAVVEAIGDEVTSVKVGDTVIFNNFATDSFEIEGKKFLVVSEDNVIGVVGYDT